MNVPTVAVGLLMILYALYVVVMRLRGRDEKFRKLGPMKERFGDRTGSTIHFVGYVLIPFGLGVLLLVFGSRGISLFELLRA